MANAADVSAERYEDDGYLCPLDALSPQQAGHYRGVLEAVEKKGSGRLPPFLNAKPHLLLCDLWQLVKAPAVVDAVETLLGPDILCFGTSFIIKPAGSTRYVAWHQDATYWGLSEAVAATAWIALSPSNATSGCVRAIAGSHKRVLDHTDSGDPDNLLGRKERLVDDVDETKAVDFVLEPGQMSIHHPLIVHGSAPNISSDRRIGFAVRYIPSRLVPQGVEGMSATLVRGRNLGGFELEVEPEADFHPAALARHRDVFRKGMTTIFGGKLQRSGTKVGGG